MPTLIDESKLIVNISWNFSNYGKVQFYHFESNAAPMQDFKLRYGLIRLERCTNDIYFNISAIDVCEQRGVPGSIPFDCKELTTTNSFTDSSPYSTNAETTSSLSRGKPSFFYAIQYVGVYSYHNRTLNLIY